MKKAVAVVLSFVLCLGMSTTVFAAESSSASNQMSGSAVIDGQPVEVSVSGVSSEVGTETQKTVIAGVLQEMNSIWEDTSLTDEQKQNKEDAIYTELFAKTINQSVKIVGNKALIEVSLPEGVAIPAEGVDITFSAYGIKEGDNITVLHLKADGTWEQIAATAGNGVITGRFTSLSPVLYAVTEAVGTPTATVTPAATTTAVTADTAAAAVTSPQTGEDNMLAVMLMIIAGCGITAAFAGRKVYTQR